MEEDLLTTAQLAEYLKVHEMTVYKLLQTQEIPAIKIGKKWRFREKTIKWWLHERESAGSLKRGVSSPEKKVWDMDWIKHREAGLYDLFEVANPEKTRQSWSLEANAGWIWEKEDSLHELFSVEIKENAPESEVKITSALNLAWLREREQKLYDVYEIESRETPLTSYSLLSGKETLND